MKLSDSDQVRKEKPAFPWLLTPNFFLCFLLFFCLFVPGFQGCSDQTIYIATVIPSPFIGFTNLAQLLAIVVFVATWLWCRGPGEKEKSTGSIFAWRSFTVLAVANFLLTFGCFLYGWSSQEKSSETSWEAIGFFVGVGAYVTLPVFVACLMTFKSERSLFFKASVMQLIMSIAGIVSALYFLPVITLAKRFYIGGILNVVGVFGVLLMSVVQLFDGERALNRKRGEPILRLTLKQTFLLMTISCVLSSLAAGLFVIEAPAEKPQVQAVDRP